MTVVLSEGLDGAENLSLDSDFEGYRCFQRGLLQRVQLSTNWCLTIQYFAPPLQHAGHIQAFAHELDLSDLLGAAAGGQLTLQHAADLHPAHIGEGTTFEIARTSRTMD